MSRTSWIAAAAFVALLPIAACTARSPARPAAETPAAVAAEPRENPWKDAARAALLEPCGGCHRPGLPTSKPGALLVFDLEEDIWYGRMSDEQLAQLVPRTSGSKSFDPMDGGLIESFVTCARGGSCEPQSKDPG